MRIKVSGTIIPNDYAWLYDWFGEEYFCPAKLENAMQEADPEDREMILEINSPGGYVFAGFEVFSILRHLQLNMDYRVEAHVTALAASAATTIMSACDTVLLSPVAQVMIHLPMTVTEGNRFDHRDSISVLKSLEESILNGYEMKSRGKATREQLRAAMEKSTWMPAQEAISLGLADGILGDEEAIITAVDLGAIASRVVNSLQEGFDLSYEEMLARYEKGVLDGVLEQHPLHPVTGQKNDQEEPFLPDGHMDADLELGIYRKVRWDEGWQQKARLEIERERFRQ